MPGTGGSWRCQQVAQLPRPLREPGPQLRDLFGGALVEGEHSVIEPVQALHRLGELFVGERRICPQAQLDQLGPAATSNEVGWIGPRDQSSDFGGDHVIQVQDRPDVQCDGRVITVEPHQLRPGRHRLCR